MTYSRDSGSGRSAVRKPTVSSSTLTVDHRPTAIVDFIVYSTTPASIGNFRYANRSMSAIKLAPSKAKKEFLVALGLSDTEGDRRLYRDMMEEAAVARERLCMDINNLTEECRRNPNLKPPFSSSMFTETALHREVMAIYRSASPHTRALYDQGNDYNNSNNSNWDNWVIRWCLWHVFRYRDERNRNRGNRGSYYPVMDVTSEDGSVSEGASPGVYDPIRNTYSMRQ